MDKNKLTIVITGATKGLGKALAEQYLKDGHQVIPSGRKTQSKKY